MEKVKIVRYRADCGRLFSKKVACQSHEKACTCWENPKFRTCKTCKWGRLVNDSNGMEHEPQFLQKWREWDCQNPKFDYGLHFTPAHEKAPDLNINCPMWEPK